MNTYLFKFDIASQGAGWIKEVNEEHIPETEDTESRHLFIEAADPFILISGNIGWKIDQWTY
ncbi:hypothetical protein [Rossellomorea vietnamensis]|uniref:hypothetical protein n=1 Tax=Rossellomorea vietnamensis TaxID=218284 RepID=UPI0020791C68|nr:hypothetical protein [Rossellomorea vietnamensis]